MASTWTTKGSAKCAVLLLALLVSRLTPGASADRIRNTEQRLPRNAAVLIDPMDGFGPELEKAFLKESVPLVIVSNKENADFEITGTIGDFTAPKSTAATDASTRTESEDEQAERGRLVMVSIVNLKTKSVIWGYGVTGIDDLSSAAEFCARAMKNQIRQRHAKSDD